MNLHEILTHFKDVAGREKQYTACCPSHEDENPSLSISEKDGKILLYCHAGCQHNDVLAAVGLKKSDLFVDKDPQNRQKIGTKTYDYRDANGALLYYKTRVDYNDGSKSFFFKQPNGTKGVKGVKRVPYNLPAVIEASTIYFVEGEKCANAIIEAERVATSLDSGAKSKWLPEYGEHFKDKTVIIIPDNDEPGMMYAKRIAKQIPKSRIVPLPELKPKEDIYDWLNAGHTMDEIDILSDYVPESREEADESDETEGKSKPTQAERLIKLVESTGADFFHSDIGDLYAAIPIDGHTEVWPLNGKDFKIWLHGIYYKTIGKSVGGEAVGQTLAILSAKARFDCQKPVKLSIRIAERDGVFWYDLADEKWRVIKVTAEGWSVADTHPIIFTQYRHQKEQIIPKAGGDIKKILQFLNLKNNHILFLCWLVCCFIPEIPHVMPIFHGEKGSAKSTACNLLKRLIDPSVLDILTLQNDPRTLAVNLQQHWFLPFDNVSRINEETSDTLCRAITGGGIQQRKLFTNSDDTIFTLKRCLAINGINNVADRPDLLDRSLLIELERINEDERRELSELQSTFEAERASILGGIFDTLVHAIAISPTIKLDKLPRMADFARWGYAVGEALGGLGEQFLNEYNINMSRQNIEAINSDSVAILVIEFMKNRDVWEGTVSKLLTELSNIAPEQGIKPNSKAFPSKPNVLSRRLNGIKSNLNAIGISFTKHEYSHGVNITLKNANFPPLSPYRQKPNNTKDLRNGDIMEITSANGDDRDSSPQLNPLQSNGAEDYGDDGGKIIAREENKEEYPEF